MEPVRDTAAFFQLLQVLGVPGALSLILVPVGILALLLFIFLRMDQKKWENIIEAHKSERDRDYKHLEQLMEGLSGQYQLLSAITSKMDLTLTGINNLPAMFRDLHGRLDIFIHSRKDQNGSRNIGT